MPLILDLYLVHHRSSSLKKKKTIKTPTPRAVFHECFAKVTAFVSWLSLRRLEGGPEAGDMGDVQRSGAAFLCGHRETGVKAQPFFTRRMRIGKCVDTWLKAHVSSCCSCFELVVEFSFSLPSTIIVNNKWLKWPSWRKWSFWRDHEWPHPGTVVHPKGINCVLIRRASSPRSSYPLPVARRIYAKWHLLLVLPETRLSGSTPRTGRDFTLIKPHLQKQASQHCMTWHGLTPRVMQWLTEFTTCSCNMLLSWYVQNTWSSSHNII